MRAEKGFQAFEGCLAVELEGVSHIGVTDDEQQANEPVGEAIEQEFRQGLVHNTASRKKAIAEHCVMP